MKRNTVNIPEDLKKEINKKLKEFNFDGRYEFWEPSPRNSGNFPDIDKISAEIYKSCKKNESFEIGKMLTILENLSTYCYRIGYARGCKEGFDDLAIFLGMDRELVNTSLEAYHNMQKAIPSYNAKNQSLKEWRNK